ncbi:outer membrane protein transport protein [Flammeovirga yaeyamensis]|uniref:Outer membrane protein transport protein n=1 Tax=Flammeovirga yaeyamensis TaxID=367791 RepID=A0AAX1N211_9BACT|nr:MULTISPECIES: outer membrane protein transport protein [Flammeovirga]ANQ51072.1 hypothetical protein MY04_3728 [Flammeovirga sp. MY04]MBB3698099.1 hypothetical protein [Flammeovirga yaeyamensis]NMF34542.1 hypothetical protein [Flammeovirga yaeyamensis]QWG01519.1 outer membrane protein transport protein [Flammeovirga yaeyamensis]
MINNLTGRKLFILTIFFLVSMGTNGQTYLATGFYKDVVNFSQQNPMGTARVRGLGGAGVSLGGDFSHGVLNPAGLGFIRKSEYHFSAGMGFTGSSASGVGTSGTGNASKFFLPEFGIVWDHASVSDNGKGAGWRGGAFSISFNRLADYNQHISYTEDGTNRTSMLNYLEEAAFGVEKFRLDEAKSFYNQGYPFIALDEMAYYLDLIKPIYGDDDESYNYYYILDRDKNGFTNTPVSSRTQVEETRGGQYETSFAYGANYDDKFYIGAKVGIQYTNYHKTSSYVELRDSQLTYLGLNEDFRTNGWGINLQTGVIWRPIDALRIGATITSPTWHTMEDTYTATMTRDYNNYIWNDAKYQDAHFAGDDPSFVYNPEGKPLYNPNASDVDAKYNGRRSARHEEIRTTYNMNTPWRASGGFSTFFGKKGFLTVDVEYVGYTAMKINKMKTYYGPYSDGFPDNTEGDNEILNEEYRNTVNIRLGGEFRVNKNFNLRAGYAFYQDPQKEEYNLGVDKSKMLYSGGLGYRNKAFYIDMAVIYSQWKGLHSPYQLDANFVDENGNTVLIYPITDITNSRTEVIFSIGKRF